MITRQIVPCGRSSDTKIVSLNATPQGTAAFIALPVVSGAMTPSIPHANPNDQWFVYSSPVIDMRASIVGPPSYELRLHAALDGLQQLCLPCAGGSDIEVVLPVLRFAVHCAAGDLLPRLTPAPKRLTVLHNIVGSAAPVPGSASPYDAQMPCLCDILLMSPDRSFFHAAEPSVMGTYVMGVSPGRP